MNSRGEINPSAFVIFLVIVAGFVLAIFTPTINEVRLAQIAQTDSSEILQLLYLYLLIPLIWFFWLVLSAMAIISVSQS